MKILVPTDFSESSKYAIDSAKKIAIRYNAQVDFYHCASKEAMLNVYEKDRELSKVYHKQIQDFVIQNLEETTLDFRNAGIDSNYLNTIGDFIDELKQLQKNMNYDLIIMGSHGQSGFKEWAIGSNAQKVVRLIPTNVMVVKKELEKLDFSEVVFVSGLDKKDHESFKRFLNFIQKLNVDMLHILAVDTAFYFTQPRFIMSEALKEFKEIADGFSVKTHFYSDYSIEAGVRHFVEEKGVSFIGITNHEQNPLRRIFTGSNVEAIVSQSKVPVLSINQ